VRHVSYGVKAAHYATAGEALLWTFDQRLGSAFRTKPDRRGSRS
jgi:hemoglobin-like flavoprotein